MNIEKIREKFEYVNEELDALEKEDYIRNRRERYKKLKNYLKEEYREYSKVKHSNSIITQWYMPILEDVYVKAFSNAKTNDNIDNINHAISLGRMDFDYWYLDLVNWMEEIEEDIDKKT